MDFDIFLWLLFALIIIAIIVRIYQAAKRNKERNLKNKLTELKLKNEIALQEQIIQNKNNNSNYENIYPYIKKELVTKNELQYYLQLIEIAEINNLTVLTKVRLADLIETKKGLSNRDWGIYFGKIKAKHIDFILAEKSNLNPILLIEVDDRTHDRNDRQKRDTFVDTACTQAGYKIAHVRSLNELRNIIYSQLNIDTEEHQNISAGDF